MNTIFDMSSEIFRIGFAINCWYIPIPIPIYIFAHQGDYEHKIVQPWLPVSQDSKYEEQKGLIP